MYFPNLKLLLLTTLWCCAAFGSAFGQSRRAYEKAGDKAFKNKDYTTAFSHYSNAMSKSSVKPGLLYKYGESARMFYAFELAEKSYLSIVKLPDGAEKYPMALFRLGEIYRMQGQYDKATDYFTRYKNSQKAHPDDPFVQQAALELQACAWASEHLNTDDAVKIARLDKKVNSPYSDFAAIGRGDTLYFSSYRFEKKGKTKTRMSRVMMTQGGRNAREPQNGIPSGDSAHVAHTAFSPDGNFLIFNYCRNVNPTDIRCELWIIIRDIKGKWTKPIRLPEPVNIPQYTSTQPSISKNPESGELTLWFSSDRPGGKGGLDIWSLPLDTIWFCSCNKPLDARKPQKLPRFETPRPVDSINTAGNEITPFYDAHSNTLYFSSDRHIGFGGYDVFTAKFKNKNISTPVNAGKGINTSYNDVYFYLRNNGKTGFLSSNRPGSLYLDERNKACCNDIYAVTLPETEAQTVPLPPVIPELAVVPPKENIPAPKPVEPPKFADFVGLPLFFDNDEPDKRTRKITTNKTYEETVLAYLDRQEEYRIKRSSGLNEADAEKAANEIDLFFDAEVRTGYDRLTQLCELLQERLQAGQAVEIVIKGFTSPRAQNDYNFSLGKRRISSVRNHITAWSDGALAGFLDSGLLRISETSFGETTARSGLSDDLKDDRNSVYHPDAARERRVEIMEIK